MTATLRNVDKLSLLVEDWDWLEDGGSRVCTGLPRSQQLGELYRPGMKIRIASGSLEHSGWEG